MRQLTHEETMLVSGGVSSSEDRYDMSWYSPSEGEIVVTGTHTGNFVFNLNVNTGTWEATQGTGNGAEVAQAAVVSTIAQAVLGFLGSLFANSITHSNERQERVARDFHPLDKASDFKVHIGNGEVRDSAVMKDGSIFIDWNQDGTFDTHVQADTQGGVWRDTGDGWQRVVGNG
jgi:hypothetical protein